MAPPSTEQPPEHAGEVVVVTGMTGAGRSTAAKELEDLGFYVVDNLPPSLLREVVRLVDESRGTSQPIAVVVDVRSGAFFESLQANLAQHAVGRLRRDDVHGSQIGSFLRQNGSDLGEHAWFVC